MDYFHHCVPLQRDLTQEERAILGHVLERESPRHAARIDALKVVAECGCGGCPTVLFGTSFDAAPVTHDHYILADYVGRTSTGKPVGVMVWANARGITQLEGYSLGGTGPVTWPAPLALRPCSAPNSSYRPTSLRDAS